MSSLILYSNPTNKAFKFLLYQSKKSKWSMVKLRQISTTTQFLNTAQTVQPPSSISNNSQKSSNRGRGGSGFKLFALTLAGFTAGIGYAVLNPDARNQIESVIPQSSFLFNTIDGFLNTKNSAVGKISPVADFSSKDKTHTETTTQQSSPKPTEILKTKPAATATMTATAAPKKAETPTVSQQKPAKKSTEQQKESNESSAQAADLDWKKTLKDFDLKEEATVNAVESKLKSLNGTVKLRVSESLNSSYVAIESLNKYRQALRAALDENLNNEIKELQWRQVTDLFDMQTADVAEANQKFATARNLLNELDTKIKELKSVEFSKNLKNLRETQTDLVNQFRLLQAEQAKLTEAIVHANVLKNYTHEQKTARNQFLKEMQALQPDGIHGVNKSASGEQLSMDELNSLLIHAHKRVIQLQNQLEKIQTTQNQQIQLAIDEQRRQTKEAAEAHEKNLYELHRKEFSLEQEKTLEAERAKADEELKKELSRQAAAHNNHLAQMLRIQQAELDSLYEKKLLIENEKTRMEFYSKVADNLGRLKGIEHALKTRANLELQANNAKQLWLAVQNLNEILNSKAEELNPSSELVELKTNLEKIRQSAPDNEFIQKILASIPESAVKTGIWSEPDLKERFRRLKIICNRVALIDERGGSLFKYFISYVQSFFIMHSFINKSKLEKSGENFSLENVDLNTFNILDYAEYYLEQGNLEYALRLMQQLKGEPHRLAKDWLKEALLLLEIKQACNLLTAYISSVYIGTKIK